MKSFIAGLVLLALTFAFAIAAPQGPSGKQNDRQNGSYRNHDSVNAAAVPTNAADFPQGRTFGVLGGGGSGGGGSLLLNGLTGILGLLGGRPLGGQYQQSYPLGGYGVNPLGGYGGFPLGGYAGYPPPPYGGYGGYGGYPYYG